MFKLISADIYRLSHKKSAYIYFAVVLVAYAVLAFVRSGGFTAESVLKDAMTLFSFFPVLAGGFIFSVLYTDDLGAKNLITLVGYGMGKTRIVLTKFVLALLCSGVFFTLLPVVHAGLYTLLSHAPTTLQLRMLFAVSLKFWLMTVAYIALSSIVVFGLQRTTFAIVTYVLFAFTVVSTLLTAVTNVLDWHIAAYLITGITDRIMLGVSAGASLVAPGLQYAVYIVAALALSSLAFHKKEMEF